jgi:uncharacterized protein (DUF433 family)
MASTSNEQILITQTERGLSIAGTRITLYDVMDYAKAQYPPKFIATLLGLTEAQVSGALDYIATNRAEVEAEYELVLQEAEELRQHYEQENRELVERIAKMPPPPGREAAWEKLQTQKARLKAKLASRA